MIEREKITVLSNVILFCRGKGEALYLKECVNQPTNAIKQDQNKVYPTETEIKYYL